MFKGPNLYFIMCDNIYMHKPRFRSYVLKLSGISCDNDTNECEDTNVCDDEYKDCINTIGSFTCSCKSGYTLDTDGTTCIGMYKAYDYI